jgi:hypothetical protein
MFGMSKNDRKARAAAIRGYRAQFGRLAAYRRFGRRQRS